MRTQINDAYSYSIYMNKNPINSMILTFLRDDGHKLYLLSSKKPCWLIFCFVLTTNDQNGNEDIAEIYEKSIYFRNI